MRESLIQELSWQLLNSKGIVKSYYSNLLQCNGEHIVCGKHWAKKNYKVAREPVTGSRLLELKEPAILTLMTSREQASIACSFSCDGLGDKPTCALAQRATS